MKHIGERIASVRESARITQTQLAKKIGSTQSAVARIESGKQNVSTSLLRKISKALNRNLIGNNPGSVNLQIDGGFELS